MDLEIYFKDKLNELENNMLFGNLISRADKKDCRQIVNDDCTLFHNECVETYYNKIIGTVNNYRETGVFADADNKEFANFIYQYYLVLRFVASHLDIEGTHYKFHYTEEDIQKVFDDFHKALLEVEKFLQCKMNQD